MNLNPLSWFTFGKGISFGSGYSAAKKGAQFFSYNGKDIFYNLNTVNDYRAAYLTCSPLKAVINKRAQMFTNGIVEVVSSKKDAKAKLLSDIIKRPNVLQTWKQFFAQLHVYTDLFGFCPVFKIEPAGMEGSGTVSSLWCLPPWLFEIEFTGNFLKQSELSGIYKSFKLNWNNNSNPIEISNCCLVLDSSIGTDNDSRLLIPDSRVKSLEYPISNIVAALKSRNTLITKKGAIGILSNAAKDASGPVPLDEKERERVQEDFSRYGLTGQDFQVIITDATLDWKPMTFPTKDLMLFEEIEDNILRICDTMGLYSDLTGALKKSTFANLDEAKKAQYQDFIIPDAANRIEQLAPFILGKDAKESLRVTYDHLEVLQESAKEKADALVAFNTGYKILWEAGLVTRGQWLDAAGLDSDVPDADKYIFDKIDSTPLAVKLGVGGTEALQAVLLAPMKADIKKSILIIVFGLTEQDAEALKGEDPEPINPLDNGNNPQDTKGNKPDTKSGADKKNGKPTS